jgi:phage terminase large subunit-like protein
MIGNVPRCWIRRGYHRDHTNLKDHSARGLDEAGTGVLVVSQRNSANLHLKERRRVLGDKTEAEPVLDSI